MQRTTVKLEDVSKQLITEARADEFVAAPRVFIAAMPKSGTHAAECFAKSVVMSCGERPWCGTFNDNAWTLNRRPQEEIAATILGQPPGTFLKGHLGYDPLIAEALWVAGTTLVFVYRDLRDVAVSQAYHVIRAEFDDRLSHPRSDLYRAMPEYGDVLKAVIEGITDETGKEWTGLIRRWEEYAGWLDVPWILKVRYEDMIADFDGVAELFFRHLAGRTMQALDPDYGKNYVLELDGEEVDEWMMQARLLFGMKHVSPTFRRGKPGGWVDDFTPEAVEAFDRTGGSDWLIQLGYENDKEWLNEWR